MSEKSYVVIFKNTKVCGGYAGVITWTVFESKNKFDELFDDKMRSRSEVLEEGVTEERAIELVCQTPLSCRVAAALEEVTDPQSGERDEDMFLFKLQEALFVARLYISHR